MKQARLSASDNAQEQKIRIAAPSLDRVVSDLTLIDIADFRLG
jgi:hypothetical protein